MSDKQQSMEYEHASIEHVSTWNRMLAMFKWAGVLIAIVLTGLLVLYFNG